MLVGKSSIIAIALANLHAEVLMLIVLDFLHISLLLFVKENFWICSSVCAYLFDIQEPNNFQYICYYI